MLDCFWCFVKELYWKSAALKTTIKAGRLVDGTGVLISP